MKEAEVEVKGKKKKKRSSLLASSKKQASTSLSLSLVPCESRFFSPFSLRARQDILRLYDEKKTRLDTMRERKQAGGMNFFRHD